MERSKNSKDAHMVPVMQSIASLSLKPGSFNDDFCVVERAQCCPDLSRQLSMFENVLVSNNGQVGHFEVPHTIPHDPRSQSSLEQRSMEVDASSLERDLSVPPHPQNCHINRNVEPLARDDQTNGGPQYPLVSESISKAAISAHEPPLLQNCHKKSPRHHMDSESNMSTSSSGDLPSKHPRPDILRISPRFRKYSTRSDKDDEVDVPRRKRLTSETDADKSFKYGRLPGLQGHLPSVHDVVSFFKKFSHSSKDVGSKERRGKELLRNGESPSPTPEQYFRNRSCSVGAVSLPRYKKLGETCETVYGIYEDILQEGALMRRLSSDQDKRRGSLGPGLGLHSLPSHQKGDMDPHHMAILFRDSRGLPVADPFLEKFDLGDLAGGSTLVPLGVIKLKLYNGKGHQCSFCRYALQQAFLPVLIKILSR